MNATARRNPADRDRAVALVRTITIGTGLASLAAVCVFGGVAAATYTGGSGNVMTAAATTTSTSTSTTSTSTPTTNSTTQSSAL
ncbi:MAG TPA: hypothetical protein VNM34_15625, partial [Verrucomicrobiae bacterium]|nr:hypothetical protein [Verrucomicrobiae bacterium]